MNVVLQHPHRVHEISGVLTFVENTATALEHAGHTVRILASADATSAEIREIIARADIVHLNSNELRCVCWAKLLGRPVVQHYHFPFWGTWKTPADAGLGFVGCLRRSLTVPWSHGQGWRRTKVFARYYGVSAARVVFRVACAFLANARVAPTEYVARDAHLPGGMDVVTYPHDFGVTETLSHEPFPSTPRFTFVGRLTGAKGPQLLVEAAAIVRDAGTPCEVTVVGDGDLRPALEARVHELGLQNVVEFTGHVPRGTALQIMAGSTAVVVPSLWGDPSPYTVIEAAALGRPVIGSSNGGIPEIIGPGIVVEDIDPRGLASAMQELSVATVAADLGRRCHDFAFEHFRPQRAAEALVAIYRRVGAR
jgi:glycosyltransferase involved in cell wall biosynthesis